MHCPHFDIRTSSFPVIFLLLLHKVFAATKINDVLTDTSWTKMRVPMNLCGEEHIFDVISYFFHIKIRTAAKRMSNYEYRIQIAPTL